jgi:DNA-binding XRE family transcriptional regulator
MIRNEQEYKEAVARLEEEKKRLAMCRKDYEKQGFSGEALERLMEPITSFHLQLDEEVKSYERLKQGQICELTNLRSLGHWLICVRIAADISQAELAKRLGVDPSQVSRDERNEYHGITLDRAAKVLEACGVKVRLKFDIEADEIAMT